MNTLMTSQYQPMLSSITKILSRRISQSDCRIQIKLNCIYMIKTITVITFLCSSKFKDEKNARKVWRNQTGYQGYQKSYIVDNTTNVTRSRTSLIIQQTGYQKPYIVDNITNRLPEVECTLFSSQVNYCHHLASVVRKLFTFHVSSPKPTWLPGPIICSDWLKFQRSSSLKLMNWLNPNCKWMIIDIGMSFTKFLFFMPIGNPRWPLPQDID